MRSFFGAIEDWNFCFNDRPIGFELRSFFGAIEDWNFQVGQRYVGGLQLRSFFGAIEDWNQSKIKPVGVPPPIAIVLRGDRGLELGFEVGSRVKLTELRSFFGAIEDWNFLASRRISLASQLRSFFGAIEDWNNTFRTNSRDAGRQLRSFFGAIEDWNH